MQKYCFRTAASLNNVNLKMFQHEPGFEFDSVPQQRAELDETAETFELKDIRESLAYQQHAKNERQTIDLTKNGYKKLPKEFRTEIKYAAGQLMSREMRKAV